MTKPAQTSQDQDPRTALDQKRLEFLRREYIEYEREAKLSSVHGTALIGEFLELIARGQAALTAPPRPDHAGGVETDALVDRFATALKAKLRFSEAKHGWQDGWMRPDWKADCQQALVGHIAKGDPVDVAGYAAFCWHHGWSTAPAQAPDKAAEREGVKALKAAFMEGLNAGWEDNENSMRPIVGGAGVQGPSSEETIWEASQTRRTALALKPTGTEAGRVVGAETRAEMWKERLERAFFDAGGFHGQMIEYAARTALPVVLWACDATPTPPTPDSTAQGDGTSQEGTR